MPTLSDMALGLFRRPRIEREAALVVDVILCLTLATFPGQLGNVASVGYFLLRDSRRGGMGKRLYGLSVVKSADGSPVSWRMALLRNLLALLPLFNVVDACHFVARGRRLADEWLGTEVRGAGGRRQEEGE